MQKELSYLSPEGYTVFTSHYLKNKGTCCKSTCLHCPYGYTLKKLGLKFSEVTETDFPLIEKIIEESGVPAVDWKTFYPEHIHLMTIKDTVCGLMLKTKLVVKHVYLRPHFQNQGLSKEIIESYFFI